MACLYGVMGTHSTEDRLTLVRFQVEAFGAMVKWYHALLARERL